MRNQMRCVWVVCVVGMLVACGQTPGAAIPTATLSAPLAPTAAPTDATGAKSIVGRWVILLSGLELEFFEDGKFLRWAETSEGFVLYDSGTYRVSGSGKLVVDLGPQGTEEYECLLDEKWLMLRGADGKVNRYWLKP